MVVLRLLQVVLLFRIFIFCCFAFCLQPFFFLKTYLCNYLFDETPFLFCIFHQVFWMFYCTCVLSYHLHIFQWHESYAVHYCLRECYVMMNEWTNYGNAYILLCSIKQKQQNCVSLFCVGKKCMCQKRLCFFKIVPRVSLYRRVHCSRAVPFCIYIQMLGEKAECAAVSPHLHCCMYKRNVTHTHAVALWKSRDWWDLNPRLSNQQSKALTTTLREPVLSILFNLLLFW